MALAHLPHSGTLGLFVQFLECYAHPQPATSGGDSRKRSRSFPASGFLTALSGWDVPVHDEPATLYYSDQQLQPGESRYESQLAPWHWRWKREETASVHVISNQHQHSVSLSAPDDGYLTMSRHPNLHIPCPLHQEMVMSHSAADAERRWTLYDSQSNLVATRSTETEHSYPELARQTDQPVWKGAAELWECPVKTYTLSLALLVIETVEGE